MQENDQNTHEKNTSIEKEADSIKSPFLLNTQKVKHRVHTPNIDSNQKNRTFNYRKYCNEKCGVSIKKSNDFTNSSTVKNFDNEIQQSKVANEELLIENNSKKESLNFIEIEEPIAKKDTEFNSNCISTGSLFLENQQEIPVDNFETNVIESLDNRSK